MNTRITIPISSDEREALRLLAQIEMRNPREQIRYLLQRELVNRGMLVKESSTVVRQDKAGAAIVIDP